MTKYQQLAQWIKEQIAERQLPTGAKLHTESELCALFGISRQTVRQALAQLEEERVIERRKGSGSYVLAPMAANGAPSMRIGVISTYIDDYIFPGIIRGIEQVLQREGYAMQLACTHNRVENERTILQQFLAHPVDGLIIEPTKSGLPNPNLPLYAQLSACGILVVFFDAHYRDLPAPYVALDDRAAGRLATEHLIEAGHREIAGFFQSDDLQGHLRYAGYVDALLAAGLPLRAEHTVWFASEDIPALFDDDARISQRLDGCTAAFCYNDRIAASLVLFARTHGLQVPEHLSVVGVDNSPLALLCDPPLTSVQHPKEALGITAAENLLRRMQNPSFDATAIFPPTLEPRKSVMPPGASLS